MAITEKNVIDVLKEILYFPKGDNIINLNMVEDIQVASDRISFTLVFEKLEGPAINIVQEQATKKLKDTLGETIQVEINAIAEKDRGRGPLGKVKHVIAVASGKGGVGKSTVAANLAVSFARKGYKTAMVDADIYGPSIPVMFGLEGQRPASIDIDGKPKIVPIIKHDVQLVSIGFFVEPDQPLIWRGPMASSTLNQLFNDTHWDEIDIMVIDLPPGTGDIQLTLATSLKVDGAVMVSTPQKVAVSDVRKAVSMFRQDKIEIPVLGIVENMAWFTPAELPDNKYYIFGKGECEKYAQEAGLPIIGRIPMVQSVAESGDQGNPISLKDNDPVSNAFNELAENVIQKLNDK
ncbi:MAG: Mrp/NBP35 family ATP-binding protein [Hyphomicrobiales bacterium]